MTTTKQDHFEWEASGRATFDGHDLGELADRFPTPFYLISKPQLRDNIAQFKRAFSSIDGMRIYYSVKSNFESIVLRTLAEEGCGAEISGALDMELARRAGMKPQNVVFDGPYKPAEDVEAALEWGIHLIDLESLTEARMVNDVAGRLGRKVRVGLRVDPLLSKPYYDKVISTYKKKFGLPIDQAVEAAAQIANLPNLELVGVMTHIGSQVFTPNRYLVTLDKLFDLMKQLAARGIHIEELNLGGGYPAQSMRNLRLSRRFVVARLLERFNRIEVDATSIDEFGARISERFLSLCRSTGLKPSFGIEPGRCLVSNAGMVVGRVLIVKNDWVFTDVSINNIPENLFFSEWRLVFPGVPPDTKAERSYNISGPTLATQDVLYFQREVPTAREGQALAILDTGAYSIARANQFTRPRIAVYGIDENRELRLVRRAENVEDVLSMQVWDDVPADEAPADTGEKKAVGR